MGRKASQYSNILTNNARSELFRVLPDINPTQVDGMRRNCCLSFGHKFGMFMFFFGHLIVDLELKFCRGFLQLSRIDVFRHN